MGGNGNRGVTVNGTILANGISIPIDNLNYWVSGIDAGSVAIVLQ